jgi:hypothetical protein
MSAKGFDGLISSVYTLGAGILNLINDIGGLPTILMLATTALIAFKNAEIIAAGVNLFNSIDTLVSAIGAMIPLLFSGTSAMYALASGLAAADVAASALDVLTGGIIAVIGLLATAAVAIASSGMAAEAKKITDSTNAMTDSLTKLNQAVQQVSQVKSLGEQYDTLSAKINRTAEENQSLLDVQNQIHTLLPGLSGEMDAYGNYILTAGTNTNTLVGYMNNQLATMRLLAQQTILNNESTDIYNLNQSKGPKLNFQNGKLTWGMTPDELKDINNQIAIMTAHYNSLDEVNKKVYLDFLQAHNVNADIISDIKNQVLYNGQLIPMDAEVGTAQRYLNEQLREGTTLGVSFSDTVLKDINTETKDYTSALDEMAKTGGVSNATVEKLYASGSKLTDYLTYANGKWQLNTQAVYADTMAQIQEQMAVDKAALAQIHLMSAIEQATPAIEKQVQAITADMNQLQAAIDEMASGTAAALQDAADKAASTEKTILSDIESMLRQDIDNQKALVEAGLKKYNDLIATEKAQMEANKKSIQDAQTAFDTMIKDETDAIKAQEDAYDKIITAKKTELQLMHDKQDYLDTLAEKEHAVSETQMQLDALSMDNSQEAMAKRLTLQDTLNKNVTDLNKTQSDNQYTQEQAALDNELKAYKDASDARIAVLQAEDEASKKSSDARIKNIENQETALEKESKTVIDGFNSEISDLDAKLANTGQIARDAWAAMADPATLQRLLDWNYNYGTSIEEDITKPWYDALAGAQEYYYWLSAIGQGVKGGNIAPGPGGQNYIHPSKGGLVTGGIPGEDSVPALVMPGEYILNKAQVDAIGSGNLKNLGTGNMGIANMPTMSIPNVTSGGGTNQINFEMPINVSGNLDRTVLPDIEKLVNKAFEKMNSAMLMRGYKRVANSYQ